MKNTVTHGRGDSAARNLRSTLRHHVTGAIERGEKVAIIERTARNSLIPMLQRMARRNHEKLGAAI